MDSADRYVEKAEEDADPNRFQTVRNGRTVERAESEASSSPIESPAAREDAMARYPTARDNPGQLERNATAMSRIETQRTQHSGTVGATIRSRKSTRPLPSFGAGKPFPPPLPEREEYVVEFDGVDDPLHAQNWPIRKK